MQEGERPVTCVNSYRLNSTKQEGPCCVYQIPQGQVASIKVISRDFRLCVSVCMSETMNFMIYVSLSPLEACAWWPYCLTPRAGVCTLVSA